MNTNQKGDIAEARLFFEASKLGYVISKPFGDCPYDAILDKSGKLYRVQVKYVTPRNGRLFKTFEPKVRTHGSGCYNNKTIDALVLYDSTTSKLYWVDVREFNGNFNISLRTEPTKNNQKKGIKMAADYLFI